MQPTIICIPPGAGMIYLNGRFAGEASPGQPLLTPVSPVGALYLEYRPLEDDWEGLARRLVFSGGRPLAEGLEGAGGLWCVAWPGGALEVELIPARRIVEHFFMEGLPCALRRDGETVLVLNGAEIALPRGAQVPQLLRLDGAAALLGAMEGGGQYLAVLAPDLTGRTGLLTADAIEPADGGLFTAISALGDTVGHGRLEQWLADGSGLHCVSAESTWPGGGPCWPRTAEGAMIAAVEAILAGLPGECEGYLSPALAAKRPLAAIGAVCDLCVPMKYGMPDARPCVGLLKAVNDHLATVRPLYYRAEPVGGGQGPWQIEEIWLERDETEPPDR